MSDPFNPAESSEYKLPWPDQETLPRGAKPQQVSEVRKSVGLDTGI